MKNKIKLSIVLPTYNERENIKLLVPSIESVLKKSKIDFEIIVVDDDSKDNTAKFAEKLNKIYKNIQVIVRTRNKGLAPSLLCGFDNCKGELIATMDSDLCHDPKHLPEMVNLLDQKIADIIIGSRYIKGSSFKGKPIIKETASRSAQAIANFILGLRIKDTTNNFRVFRNEVYRKIRGSLHPTGNIMLTEFLYLANKGKFKIKEIPTHYIEQRKDKTRLNLFKETFNFIYTLLKIRLNIR